MTESHRLPAGTHDILAEVYHSDPCMEPSLSSTLARNILFQSPLHAWTASPRLNPELEPVVKSAFEIGRAAHTALLSKGQLIHVMSHDSYRTNAAKEERDEARAAGMTVLKLDEWAAVDAMVGAARSQIRAHGIGDVFEYGRNELAHFAEIGGIWCRALTDCMHDGLDVIYDYKTTASSAEPGAVIRTICSYGYDVQAAHYLDVVEAVTGRTWKFRFVMQEKEPPWALSVVEIDESWLVTARKKVARARELWRMCLEKYGDSPWPGYPSQIAVLSAPTWHDTSWLNREEREADYRRRTGSDVLGAAMQWHAPLTPAA